LIALILEAQARRMGVERMQGMLDVHADGFGFLRRPGEASGEGVYVSPSQIRRFELRRGDLVVGLSRPPKDNERYHGLIKIESVNGREPDALLGRPLFERRTAVRPLERLTLGDAAAPFILREIDLFAPLGQGQRAVVLGSSNGSGSTLLVEIAKSLRRNYPAVAVLPLLVDARPEDVTEARRSFPVEIAAGSLGDPPDQQAHLADLTLDRAKRIAELGGDAVLLIDSLAGLARAYEARYRGKRFLAAARRLEEGGSLTIVAAAVAPSEGPAEFIESANATIALAQSGDFDGSGFELDLARSRTAHAEELLSAAELRAAELVRRACAAAGSGTLTETLRRRLREAGSADEFVRMAGDSA
jgi:transcription termination factor Rho